MKHPGFCEPDCCIPISGAPGPRRTAFRGNQGWLPPCPERASQGEQNWSPFWKQKSLWETGSKSAQTSNNVGVLRRGDTEPIPAPLHRGSQVTDLASLGACTPNEAETELKMTTEEKNHPSTGNTNKNIDTVLDNFGEGADPLMLPHMKVINRAGSVRGVVCVFRKTGLRFGSGRKSHSHERVLVSFRVSVNASVCHE